MRVMLSFSYEEIHRELPYAIIGETASRSIWDIGKRKRLWSREFTEAERETCYKIIAQAKKWLLTTGVPDKGVVMSTRTYDLWHRLADFCACL